MMSRNTINHYCGNEGHLIAVKVTSFTPLKSSVLSAPELIHLVRAVLIVITDFPNASSPCQAVLMVPARRRQVVSVVLGFA
ncbi:hypothetical protein KCP75_01715 [Salmonella enterica subsp. enterica]|nr:hypothetical protein KCP75_01715 [Salmonella enterica subsp. enterica]